MLSYYTVSFSTKIWIDTKIKQNTIYWYISLDELFNSVELLSQLSTARRSAAAAQSISSQLHQLELQLQSTRYQHTLVILLNIINMYVTVLFWLWYLYVQCIGAWWFTTVPFLACGAVGWLPGRVVRWLPGRVVRWLPGRVVRWLPGRVVRWLPGRIVR